MLYTNKCLEEHERQQQNIGVWLSLARAPGLGPGGRRFESCHPDPFYGKLFYAMVGIAQLVSAPDCGSGGLGFESLYPPFLFGLSPSGKAQDFDSCIRRFESG